MYKTISALHLWPGGVSDKNKGHATRHLGHVCREVETEEDHVCKAEGASQRCSLNGV